MDVCGKTIGIVGLGRIGKEVALRAKGFSMNIVAHDPLAAREFAAAHDITYHGAVDQCERRPAVLLINQ